MRTGNYKDGSIITALGHDGFAVNYPDKNLSFAFDPFDVKEVEPVDYVFVSHPHFDHCDLVSIRKLSKPTTVVIAPESCQKELAEYEGTVKLVSLKGKSEEKLFKHWVIPAYNIDKYRTPSEVFHPQELGGVGHIVEVGSTRFFHAGDSDLTPELEALKKIDVAFLPISGTFVMTLEEAIKACKVLEPDVAIPMHYGKLLGSVSDAYRFQNLMKEVPDVKVMVLSTEDY